MFFLKTHTRHMHFSMQAAPDHRDPASHLGHVLSFLSRPRTRKTTAPFTQAPGGHICPVWVSCSLNSQHTTLHLAHTPHRTAKFRVTVPDHKHGPGPHLPQQPGRHVTRDPHKQEPYMVAPLVHPMSSYTHHTKAHLFLVNLAHTARAHVRPREYVTARRTRPRTSRSDTGLRLTRSRKSLMCFPNKSTF